MNQMANGTTDANSPGMFANCSIPMAATTDASSIPPKKSNTSWKTETPGPTLLEKKVSSSVSDSNEVETTVANLAKRSLQEQSVSNSELIREAPLRSLRLRQQIQGRP